MKTGALLPADFVVPLRVDGDGFHLRMLSIHDVIKDFAAVMDCADWLPGFMNPRDTWPTGLTIEENLIDLGWHHREFTNRRSFAYTVMNGDESRCLGCCYIYGSDHAGFEAEAYYWARDKGMDDALGASFRGMLQVWPFKSVAYPGRDIPWERW